MPGVSIRLIFVLVPLEVGERGGERVLAGDRFFVVVGDRRAFVDLAESVDGAGVEQQRRDQLRLARAAVSDERHVPDAGRVEDLHTGNPPIGESYIGVTGIGEYAIGD